MEYIEYDLNLKLHEVPEESVSLDIRIGPVRIKGDIVIFNGRVIGEVINLNICSDPLKQSTLSMKTNGSIGFVRLATELSMYGVSLSFEEIGEFWQHSYRKNNVWVADVIEGDQISIVVL